MYVQIMHIYKHTEHTWDIRTYMKHRAEQETK